jgi:hypothetical protein
LARLWAFGLLLATAVWTVGCIPQPPKTRLRLAELIGQYNRNAARVPQLWARAKISMRLPMMPTASVDSRTEFSGLLLLLKSNTRLGPHDFLLAGREGGAEVFRIGCSTSDGVCYFWHAFGDKPALHWRRSNMAGAPEMTPLPIDPLQIPAVLGICELPADLTQLPGAALSMNTEPGKYAYAVTYLDRQPLSNRILFRREVHFNWDDDVRPRPFRVDFFDREGMRVLTAELRDYRPIERVLSEGSSDYWATMVERKKPPPVMPTDIRIRWARTDAFIHISLSQMRIDRAGGGAGLEDFHLWENLPDHVARHCQLVRSMP